MEPSFDVVALGELLIDFTENGVSAQGNTLFEACPGGAPCNVLAMLRKLGRSCAFVGKVGDDLFGRLLKGVLEDVGISTQALLMDRDIPTTLAFVKTAPNGELLKKTRIFHFGTLSMTHEGVRQATLRAVQTARDAGAWISFDPNLRPPLWDSLDNAKEAIAYGLSQCHILKIADKELEFMTGERDFARGAGMLQKAYPNIRVLNVTAGAEGSYSFYGDADPVFVPACTLGGVIETTGAGDTFCASVLDYVLTHGLENLTPEHRREMLRFANTAAYIVTTRKGAIRAMPREEEVRALL